MTWGNAWEEAKKTPRAKLTVLEPPCKNCHYWDPHPEYDRLGDFNGIRCCTNDNMYSDFSCYHDKGLTK